MSQVLRNPKMRLLVIAAVATGAYWLQAELLAERSSSGSEVSAKNGAAIDCLDCQEGLIVIPHAGDPEIDQAYRDAVKDMIVARNNRFYEDAQREHDRKREIWHGTSAELSPHPLVTDAERESVAPFLELFETDPPAPKVRREHFAEFLEPDSPDRCVGWRAFLRFAEEVDDGWLVDVEVGVHLLGPGPGQLPISIGTTDEIWHVSREGKLTFVEGSPGEAARVYVRM